MRLERAAVLVPFMVAAEVEWMAGAVEDGEADGPIVSMRGLDVE